MAHCAAEPGGWRLPGPDELIGLALLGRLLMLPTDYWSGLRLGRYAFGLNTKSRLLSFDRIEDTDHLVCVRQAEAG